jgi:hypothetical protein
MPRPLKEEQSVHCAATRRGLATNPLQSSSREGPLRSQSTTTTSITETNQPRCLTTSPRRSLARRPRCTRSVRGPEPSTTSNPQLTTHPRHHPDLAQGCCPREGLLRAHRARQEQGPPRQGPRPPAHQDPQDHGALPPPFETAKQEEEANKTPHDNRPARPLAVRVPRPGISSRCASTSA